MPVTIPTGFFQATYLYSAPGQSGEVATVLGHSVNGVVGNDFRDAIDTFQDFFVEQLLPVPVTFLGAIARYGPQPGGVVLEYAPDPAKPTQGLQGTNILPINNAVLIKKLTALGGRANQGRIYTPGIDEDIVDNAGVIAPASVAALQTACDDYIAELVAQNVEMHVLHSDPLLAPTLVTALQVSNKMATQRTRLRD